MSTKAKLNTLIFNILLVVIFIHSCENKEEDIEPEPEPPKEDFEIINGSLEDIDGNIYVTVFIGGQEWMAENLKTTRYRDGTEIEYIGNDNDAWKGNATEAYSWYHNLESNKNIYGAIYNWHAVDDPRGLCPDGWRVPDDQDWTQLGNYLMSEFNISNDKGDVKALGNRLKSCRQAGSPLGPDCDTNEHPRWHKHGIHHGFDDFGFAALPIGSRSNEGTFISNSGYYGNWWSSTAHSLSAAYSRYITYDNGQLFRTGSNMLNGYAVRCMRNYQ